MCVCAHLWGSVGDALQDPVDGGRVQRQVFGRLHLLLNYLVLDALAADLPKGAEQVEEVAVQAVFQVRGHFDAHLAGGESIIIFGTCIFALRGKVQPKKNVKMFSHRCPKTVYNNILSYKYPWKVGSIKIMGPFCWSDPIKASKRTKTDFKTCF